LLGQESRAASGKGAIISFQKRYGEGTITLTSKKGRKLKGFSTAENSPAKGLQALGNKKRCFTVVVNPIGM